MVRNEEIIIAEFDKGIGFSPHTGYGDMRNLDIFSVPGEVILNNPLVKMAGSAIGATVDYIIRDPTSDDSVGHFYALNQNGTLYKSTDYGANWNNVATWTGAGKGLAVWKNHLMIPFNSGSTYRVGIYGPLSGSAVWTSSSNFDFDNSSSWYPQIVSNNDGYLYGGAKNHVYKLEEISGTTFSVEDTGTFTFDRSALDLPANYYITCFEELGGNLMVGTRLHSTGDFKVADIFPWDRSSTSYGTPLKLNVNGVSAMRNINNILYVSAGLEGKIYATNGAQATPIAQLPLAFSKVGTPAGTTTKSVYAKNGAFVCYKERLVFGMGNFVWSLLPTTKGNILSIEHSIGTFIGPTINSLCPVSQDEILVGWSSTDPTTNYRISKTNNLTRDYEDDSYAGYLASPLYRVGTYNNLRTFTEVEFQLSEPLIVGQGVGLYYRNNLYDGWTAIGTCTHSTASTTQIGAVSSHVISSPGIPACEFVQIKAALEPGSVNVCTSPHLRTIIIR